MAAQLTYLGVVTFVFAMFGLYLQGGHAQKQNTKTATEQAQQLFQDVWNWKLSNFPSRTTLLGFHNYDDQLEDLSEESYAKRQAEMLEFSTRAESLEKDTSLTSDDKLNLNILKEVYTRNAERSGNQRKYLLYSKVYGPHRYIHRIFKAMPLKVASDYEVMLKRLEKVPVQINQMIDIMKSGMKQGYMQHQVSIADFNSSLTKFLVKDPKDSVFYKIFSNYSQNLTNQQKMDFDNRCQQIIRDKITPAYEKFGHFMTVEYKTRPNVSISSIPGGEKYYQHCVKFYTSTDLTAQEIHNIGLREVERIEGEIMEVMQELGRENMTIKEFSNMILADQNNYHKNAEEVEAEFKRLCNDVVPPKLPALFSVINNATSSFIIEGDPVSTSAYYIKGSFDGTRPGTFVFPTFNIRPKLGMLTLSLHEVSPGHHFHFSYLKNFNEKEMRDFRKLESHTFFTEGWALYAEKLGFEMGLYGDPLDKIGHLNAELFRACRLVVDTGIHALDWPAQKAIDFMSQRLAKLVSTLEREVYRYITNPGQALAYKMGELKIKELRKKAEDRLLKDFDVKEFHDIVLSSHGGSMSLVDKRVNDWIQKNDLIQV